MIEPLATKIVNEGYGYKVKQLGTLTDNVPYTAYNARISYIKNNKETIEKFDKAIQRGLDFVNNNSSDKIAIDSYKQNNTWPQDTTFTEKSFNHLQDIVIEAGFLDKKVSYKDLIYEK